MSERGSELPSMGVEGVGAVTAVGRRMEEIVRGLGEVAGEGPRRVADGIFAVPALAGKLRRADRFIRMAAAAAVDARGEAERGFGAVAAERVGLVLASGLGSHVRGFRFLDGILDCGDSAALPTDFSHSVHGAASAYVAEILGVRGPSMTITDFECGVEQGLLLAQCWLAGGICDRVVFGAVEELGEVMEYCVGKMVADPRMVPGEGAVFWVLGKDAGRAEVVLEAAGDAAEVDLLMVEEPAIRSGARRYSVAAREEATVARHFGYSAGGAAFSLLGGYLAMRTGRMAGRRIAGVEGVIDSAAVLRPSSAAVGGMPVLRKVAK